MICSKQRSAWRPASGEKLPSGSPPTLPETMIRSPTRIARVKLACSSKRESGGMRWRPSCGSATMRVLRACSHVPSPSRCRCLLLSLTARPGSTAGYGGGEHVLILGGGGPALPLEPPPPARPGSTAGYGGDDHVVIVGDGDPAFLEVHRQRRARRGPADLVGAGRLADGETRAGVGLLSDEALRGIGVAEVVLEVPGGGAAA